MTTTRRRRTQKPRALAAASTLAAIGVFFAAWGGLAIREQPTPESWSGQSLSTVSSPTVRSHRASRSVPARPTPRTRTRSS